VYELYLATDFSVHIGPFITVVSTPMVRLRDNCAV